MTWMETGIGRFKGSRLAFLNGALIILFWVGWLKPIHFNHSAKYWIHHSIFRKADYQKTVIFKQTWPKENLCSGALKSRGQKTNDLDGIWILVTNFFLKKAPSKISKYFRRHICLRWVILQQIPGRFKLKVHNHRCRQLLKSALLYKCRLQRSGKMTGTGKHRTLILRLALGDCLGPCDQHYRAAGDAGLSNLRGHRRHGCLASPLAWFWNIDTNVSFPPKFEPWILLKLS